MSFLGARAPAVEAGREELERPLAVRLLIGLGLTLAGSYTVFAVGGWSSPGLHAFFAAWVYPGAAACGAILCAWRAIRVREDRASWWLIALAFALELTGNTIESVLYGTQDPPTPSAADPFWIAFYVPLAAALGLRVRAAGSVRGAVILDILIASAALSSISAVFVLEPVLHSGAGSIATYATALVYPVADLVLAALVVNLAGASGWRLDRATGLMAGCILAWVATDSIYAVQAVHGSYVQGGILDLGWVVPYALFGVAAWMRPARHAAVGRTPARQAVVVPVAFAVVALAVVVHAALVRGHALSSALAAVALVCVITRLVVTLRGYQHVLDLQRQILDTAHDAFIAIDEHGAITDWNDQAQASFGWTREEALGRDYAKTIVPESRRAEHLRAVRRAASSGDASEIGQLLQRTVLHRSGREFTVERTLSQVPTRDGYSLNVFLRDITARKRAEDELALARDRALEASRMKSAFVANVSHEIRTPMNGVIGMSELLLDTELDEEQREYAEMITSSGDALLEVIDDILDFSKIEAGKLELDPTDFDLRDTVERACGVQAARAHEKGLELIVAIDPGLPALLRGDVARLRQVTSNFVSNAIKFTVGGEVVVRVSATAATADAVLVRLEVSDTGIGIENGVLKQLFQPFSQADSSTTRKYGGTGLGLAIAKQLVELMGGSVGAESEPGKGSSFWFEVTLARVPPAAGAPALTRDLAGVGILVVDDNATSRAVLRRQLSFREMRCEVAADAVTAIELLRSGVRAGTPFALALIDQHMPGADGYALAAAIRAEPALRDMRLVLLGSADCRSGSRGPNVFDGVLTKPVRQSRLHEELRALMDSRRPAFPRTRPPARVEAPRTGRQARPEVLVVEDMRVNQAVVVRMLEKCGFDAQVADDGRKALDSLAQRPFAAVLMDCQMPELDGYEATRAIRGSGEDWCRVPVIAMTAGSMRGERERCLAAGMDDYLTKPLRNEALREMLARWVSRPAAGPPAALPLDVEPGARDLIDEGLIASMGFDAEGLAELRGLYFEQASGQLDELGSAISGAATLTVADVAHALRGTSASIGAARVAGLASQLEATAKAQDLAPALHLLEQMRLGLADTRRAFASR